MAEEIQKGIKLKKVKIEEKYGLDYLKTQGSGSLSKKASQSEEKETAHTEIKGDIFSEMRKVQLKKINK
jgi:hypothetical protein